MTIRTKLAEEAQRYLAVVDFFRAQGCEPHWRPERDGSDAIASDAAEAERMTQGQTPA